MIDKYDIDHVANSLSKHDKHLLLFFSSAHQQDMHQYKQLLQFTKRLTNVSAANKIQNAIKIDKDNSVIQAHTDLSLQKKYRMSTIHTKIHIYRSCRALVNASLLFLPQNAAKNATSASIMSHDIYIIQRNITFVSILFTLHP